MQTTTTPVRLTHALKEWQVAVAALAQGETILLLRKGGIREVGGRFTVQHDRVLLYPTYEHQQPQLLKSPYNQQVTPVVSGWHPEQITITAWAEITHTFQVTELNQVTALLPFHIWNAQFVTERVKWKPKQPLYGLLLRVYRVPQPQQIAYHPTYGGCKSWIELKAAIASSSPSEGIDLHGSTPVLQDEDYGDRVIQIQRAIQQEREP